MWINALLNQYYGPVSVHVLTPCDEMKGVFGGEYGERFRSPLKP